MNFNQKITDIIKKTADAVKKLQLEIQINQAGSETETSQAGEGVSTRAQRKIQVHNSF
jgi:hypothetical protein